MVVLNNINEDSEKGENIEKIEHERFLYQSPTYEEKSFQTDKNNSILYNSLHNINNTLDTSKNYNHTYDQNKTSVDSALEEKKYLNFKDSKIDVKDLNDSNPKINFEIHHYKDDIFIDKDKESGASDKSFLDKSYENTYPKVLSYLTFIRKLSAIAFPAMLFYLFVILMQAINLIFIGIKYNSKEMAESISSSNLYINCTLFAIIMGLISGMDTLCSNAYAVKKYYLMGLYVHRARIVTYIVTLIIVIIHIFTAKYVLELFRFNEKVKSDSILYTYYSLIYVFFDVQSAINLRLLNVLRKAHISFIILFICISVHPLWNYIFILNLDWGIEGSAIAFTLGRIVLCILTTAYLWIWHPVPESNFWINKRCFYELGSYLKFSAGSTILMCAEWWPFELLTFMASFMNEIEYNAHVYCAELNSLIFSLPVGISLATTIYISDYITKCDINVVKKVAVYSTIFGFCCSIVVSFTLFLTKSSILRMFTKNEEILSKGEEIILLICFTHLLDMIQFTFSSILRGLGKQTLASVMSVFQFYVVMLSLAYFFGMYMNMGVTGIWLAILIGFLIAVLLYFLTLLYIDWDKVKEETVNRLENDQKVLLLDESFSTI